jgi:hypothetical protein
MSRLIIAILVVTFSFFNICGQEIIKNPSTPENKNAGRVITAQKIMEIRDGTGEYFFKWPYRLKTGPDGSIYMMDKDQLLQFTPTGKFVKNFLKVGKGPGETTNVTNYVIREDNSLVLHNWGPNKVLFFNSKGEFVSETRLPFETFCEFFSMDKNNYYFFRAHTGKSIRGVKYINIYKEMQVISRADKSVKTTIDLPLKVYMLTAPNGPRYMINLIDLISSRLRDNLVYFSNTFEYGIKLFDLENPKMIREINREFKRVKVDDENKKYLNSGQFSHEGKLYKSPYPEYFLDILGFYVLDGKLLVITSTVDKEKGVLVDVYNEKGKYIDNFYIKLPDGFGYLQMNHFKPLIQKDLIYTIETDEDENFRIVKYRLSMDI